MTPAILLYNPISGNASIAENLDYIIQRYHKAGLTLIPIRITRDKEFLNTTLRPLIETLAPHHITIAGGDGTINRYVNWAVPLGIDTPIAIIPAGTANDFAKSLGLTPVLRKTLDKILQLKLHPVDLGQVNDKYFINILSAGLMTAISQNTHTTLKNLFGRVAYYFNAIGELPTFKRLKLEIESPMGQYKVDCLLVMVFNGRTAGNLPVAKNAAHDDGLLEVIIMRGENIATTIGDLFHVLLQVGGDYPADVIYFRTPSLKIYCTEKAPADIDGEKAPQFPMTITCLEKKLSMIY